MISSTRELPRDTSRERARLNRKIASRKGQGPGLQGSASLPGGPVFGRGGGFGLYGILVLLVGSFLIVAFFFPQYFRMRSGIYRISCKEIRRKIEVAISNFDSNNTRSFVQPGKVIPLDFLKAEGFLSEIQRCPEGGKYIFGPGGETLCTIHRPNPKDEAESSTPTQGPESKGEPGAGK